MHLFQSLHPRESSIMRRGDKVCMVGEWRGDTGDAELEAQLLSSFRLTQQIPLPNWTDTVHELTIWERIPSREPVQVLGHSVNPEGGVTPEDHTLLSPVACSGCGGSSQAGSGGGRGSTPEQGEDGGKPSSSSGSRGGDRRGGKGLRRCRYCREVAYCSVDCAETHSAAHAEVHALRLIFFKDHVLDFLSEADFVALA